MATLVPVSAEYGTCIAGLAHPAATDARPDPSHYPPRLPCPRSVLVAGQASPSGGIS
jgi:hypothetical protein